MTCVSVMGIIVLRNRNNLWGIGGIFLRIRSIWDTDETEPPPVCCPACGAVCRTMFVLRGSDVALGCENCVAAYDADLWVAA